MSLVVTRLLGRETDLTIGPEDFSGNSTLINLSNLDISQSVRGKPVRVRAATKLPDVVSTVLRVTHADLPTEEKTKLLRVARSLFETFALGDVNLLDRQIIETVSVNRDSDLLRGMKAFGEAEQYQHDGMYEATIVHPATLLAGWMIQQETELLIIE